MLYQLRGRVRSNESVSTSILHNEMDMFKFSQWAPITLFYANMSHFEFNNFTLNVQRPIEIYKSNGNNDDHYHYQCLFNNEYNNDLSNNSLSPSPPPPPLTTTKPPPTTTTTMLKIYDFNQYNNNNTHYIHRQYSINHSLLNKNSYCLHMKWNISGNLYGLLGFAIQFFIPFNSPDMNDQLHNNRNLLQQCVQFLWLPCNGCLGNYSLRNVHPNVLEKLRKLIDICKLDGNPYQPTLNTYSIQYNLFHDLTNQNSLLSPIDNLQMKLNTLQLNEFNQITYNETRYKFDYYYYIINPIISIMNSKYSHRSIIVKRDLYSLNQSVSSPSSSSTTTISSSSSKTVDSQHSGYVIVYSVTANDVIYSIKHKWRINSKQPDPINIHDFMNWSEKNRNSLREEFKSLNIHSYRQEQAKHLTCAIGQRPENRLRNKYRNLLPFDQNYVQLSSALILPESEQINSVDQSKENGVITHNDENTNQNEDIINVSQGLPDIGSEQWIPSNYMNASWIPSKIPGISSTIVSSGQLPCKYIASQAPVDHTRNSDNDDDTSELYSNKHLQANSKRIVQFGRFKIHLLSKTNYSVYIRRSLKLYDCKTLNNEQYRNIIQLHMLNWPDFSTPSKEDFLRLLYAYWTERRLSMNNSPVLVHCSAGVGRTGTFICLDQLCQQVRYYLQPNLQIFLHKMNQINEPIYVNLNKEDSGVDEDESMEDHHSTIHENLLHKNSLNISIDNEKRTKRFLFHRRNYNNTQSLNIFNTVLWLRSKRSHMVQTM
ncbi:uncharacterized protein DC041_0000231, partial [Schistosoma bovis]